MLNEMTRRILARPTLKPRHLEILFDRNRRTIAKGIKDGTFPSVLIGETVNIPTAPIVRMLGLDPVDCETGNISGRPTLPPNSETKSAA